jgi:hypothetical protein
MVVDLTVANGWSVQQAKALAEAVREATTLTEATSIANRMITEIRAMQPAVTAPRPKAGPVQFEAPAIMSPEYLMDGWLVDEAQLVRAALEGAVLRGQYAALRQAHLVQQGTTKLQIGLPKQLHAAVQPLPVNTMDSNQALVREHMMTSQLKLEAYLTGAHGFDMSQSGQILQRTSNRIIEDIHSGSLQFVRLVDARQIDAIVRPTLEAEIAIAKAPPATNRFSSSTTANYVEFGDEAIPYPVFRGEILKVPEQTRRAFIMAALYGMPLASITQLYSGLDRTGFVKAADEITGNMRKAAQPAAS